MEKKTGLLLVAIAALLCPTEALGAIPPWDECLSNLVTLNDTGYYNYSFPFPWQYYGETIQTTQTTSITSDGVIDLTGNGFADYTPELTDIQNNKIIAPLWTDLGDNTNSEKNKVYRCEYPDHTVFRWNTKEYNTTNVEDFEAQIFSDGKIYFVYKTATNTTSNNIAAAISNGDGTNYQLLKPINYNAPTQNYGPITTGVTCPNGACSTGENCPADATDCPDNVCKTPTCTNGCGETTITNTEDPGQCDATNAAGSCAAPPCACDGTGGCVNKPPENCCNGIDDDGDGLEDGEDTADCGNNVTLLTGVNNICWWTRWNDYTNGSDYWSGVYSCPAGGKVAEVNYYINTEGSYDFVYIYDGTGATQLYSDSGLRENQTWQQAPATESSIKFYFHSDGSAVYDGVKINSIKCEVSPPIVTLTATPPSGMMPLAVNFTATCTDPEARQLAECTLDFGDGTSESLLPNGGTTIHTYSTAKVWGPKIVAQDADGLRAEKQIAVRVTETQPGTLFSISSVELNPQVVEAGAAPPVNVTATIIMKNQQLESDKLVIISLNVNDSSGNPVGISLLETGTAETFSTMPQDFTFSTAGLQPGNYSVAVEVSDAGSGALYGREIRTLTARKKAVVATIPETSGLLPPAIALLVVAIAFLSGKKIIRPE